MTSKQTKDATGRAALARLFALPPEQRILAAASMLDDLRDAMKEVSDSRRMAVRELRSSGYTLQEIATMVGTTPQRIHQIENGYGRKEKAYRKTP